MDFALPFGALKHLTVFHVYEVTDTKGERHASEADSYHIDKVRAITLFRTCLSKPSIAQLEERKTVIGYIPTWPFSHVSTRS